MARNPVHAFFDTRPGLAPVLLRAGLASVFLFHGGQKAFGWFGGEGFARSMELMTDADTFAIPAMLAATAIMVEVAIVPLFILGLFTRMAALGGAAVAAGALLFIHRGGPYEDLELPLLVLASSLALLLQGAGSLSLDRPISRAFLPQIGSYEY